MSKHSMLGLLSWDKKEQYYAETNADKCFANIRINIVTTNDYLYYCRKALCGA